MKTNKLVKDYQSGIRTAITTSAWAKYCRENGSQKNYMRRQYADPDSMVLPNIANKSAINRVLKKGGYVTQSEREMSKIKLIYLKCHRMNIRDGKGVWSVDHIKEIADGGSHTHNNLQIILSIDNMAKAMLAKIVRYSK